MTVRRIKTPTSRKARTMPIASHIISVGRLPPPWGVPLPLSMVVAVEAMVSMLDVSCIVYKDGTVSSRLRWLSISGFVFGSRQFCIFNSSCFWSAFIFNGWQWVRSVLGARVEMESHWRSWAFTIETFWLETLAHRFEPCDRRGIIGELHELIAEVLHCCSMWGRVTSNTAPVVTNSKIIHLGNSEIITTNIHIVFNDLIYSLDAI